MTGLGGPARPVRPATPAAALPPRLTVFAMTGVLVAAGLIVAWMGQRAVGLTSARPAVAWALDPASNTVTIRLTARRRAVQPPDPGPQPSHRVRGREREAVDPVSGRRAGRGTGAAGPADPADGPGGGPGAVQPDTHRRRPAGAAGHRVPP